MMPFEEYAREYAERAKGARDRLEDLVADLDAGLRPKGAKDKRILEGLAQALDAVSEAYDAVVREASSYGITEEGLGVDDYVARIGQVIELTRIEGLRRTIQAFLSVSSVYAHFDDELVAPRARARATLGLLETNPTEVPDDAAKLEGWFLAAVRMGPERLRSLEGIELVGEVEAALGSRLVGYGLMAGAYEEEEREGVDEPEGASLVEADTGSESLTEGRDESGGPSDEEAPQALAVKDEDGRALMNEAGLDVGCEDRACACDVSRESEEVAQATSALGDEASVRDDEVGPADADDVAESAEAFDERAAHDATRDTTGEAMGLSDDAAGQAGTEDDVAHVGALDEQPGSDETDDKDEGKGDGLADAEQSYACAEPLRNLGKRVSAKSMKGVVRRMSPASCMLFALVTHVGTLTCAQALRIEREAEFMGTKWESDVEVLSAARPLLREGLVVSYDTPRGIVLSLTTYGRDVASKPYVRQMKPTGRRVASDKTVWRITLDSHAYVSDETITARELTLRLDRVDLLLAGIEGGLFQEISSREWVDAISNTHCADGRLFSVQPPENGTKDNRLVFYVPDASDLDDMEAREDNTFVTFEDRADESFLARVATVVGADAATYDGAHIHIVTDLGLERLPGLASGDGAREADSSGDEDEGCGERVDVSPGGEDAGVEEPGAKEADRSDVACVTAGKDGRTSDAGGTANGADEMPTSDGQMTVGTCDVTPVEVEARTPVPDVSPPVADDAVEPREVDAADVDAGHSADHACEVTGRSTHGAEPEPHIQVPVADETYGANETDPSDEPGGVMDEVGRVPSLTRESVLTMGRPDEDEACALVAGIVDGRLGSWECATDAARYGVALTFARALTLKDDTGNASRLFQRMVLATDAEVEPHDYNVDQIGDAFTGATDDLSQALLLCTYLRAMLDPANTYDYELWSAFDLYDQNYDDFFGNFGELRSLFHEMSSIHTVSPEHGFTRMVVERLERRAQSKDQLREIRAKAAKLVEVRKVQDANGHVFAFHKAAFGKGSELGRAMVAIEANDEGALGWVRELAHRLAGDDLEAGRPNASAVDADIERVYKERVLPSIRNRHKGNDTLGYDALPIACREYGRRIEVLCDWVSYKDSKSSDGALVALGRKRDRILEVCDRTLAALGERGDVCGLGVVRSCVADIRDRLRPAGGTVVEFSDFLRTPYLSLTDDLVPILDEEEDKVSHFEPWRRVLCHALEMKPTFEDALALTETMGSPSWENLHQAAQLRTMLGQRAKGAGDLRRAQVVATQLGTKLTDELEMDFACGRIDDDERETLASAIDDLRDHLFERRDFAVWRLLLEAVRLSVRDLAAPRYEELRRRFDACAELVADDETELLEETRELLEDEHNLAVVEDYLNHIEAGERLGRRREMEESDDVFQTFMSNDVYLPLFDLCASSRSHSGRPVGVDDSRSFKAVARQYVRDRHASDWRAEQLENAGDLINSWPSNNRYNTTQLRDLFRGMGFDNATHGERVKATDDKAEHYRVCLAPKSRNAQSYSHPIAEFGTQAMKAIDVVVIHENASATTILDYVTRANAQGAVAVIVDYHLDTGTRRQVAELYMKKDGRPAKFLLIDRVLLLHLALAQERERLPILLKCTLPLTYVQPFKAGAGYTPDEMFCGRETELDAICRFDGACIIYGGRQLGKTALLMRAAGRMGDPKQARFALRVSILGMTDERQIVHKACHELNGELARKRRSLKVASCDTFQELCDRIDALLERGDVAGLLLMFDEVDDFLVAIEPNRYRQVELLWDLHLRHPDSFKFVLAGLHNVSRATRGTKNVVFGGMPDPLCIRPLPPKDALRLLRRPLGYLGFDVEHPNVETILTNTNYYPGLVQFFGYKLVESMSTHFGRYYSAARGNPPYPLSRQQLANILKEGDINSAIREKFMMTLELDERDRYMLIAQIVAAMYYDLHQRGGITSEGFAAADIKHFADDYGFEKLSSETADSFKLLLDEMCEMGVLSHANRDQSRYRIRRRTFLSYIGDAKTVWEALGKEPMG